VATALRAGAFLLAMVVLAACGGEAASSSQMSQIGAALIRLDKPGKLNRGPMALKVVDEAGVARPAGTASRELNAMIGGLRAVLDARPGSYALTAAGVLDNATLAAQNESTPNYGQMLERWGRQTGYLATFEQQSGESTRLVRASALLSRYGTAAGAHAAYVYVVEQEGPRSRGFYLTPPAGGRPPWDEAIVFYRETPGNNGVTLGFYTFIFRTNTLIGFVYNWGVAGEVSTRDTADLALAVLERLRGV
jgi:hypothetical protein